MTAQPYHNGGSRWLIPASTRLVTVDSLKQEGLGERRDHRSQVLEQLANEDKKKRKVRMRHIRTCSDTGIFQDYSGIGRGTRLIT